MRHDLALLPPSDPLRDQGTPDEKEQEDRRRQLVEMEDGRRFLTAARTVRPAAVAWGAARAEFAIGLGCDARHAASLAWAVGLDLGGPAEPIGPGCAACHRASCRQRSLPPAGARLAFDERQRGLTPFRFTDE